jgi:cell division inhibitor SepF
MQEDEMAAAFRKMGVYLGLVEDDGYADGAEGYAPVARERDYSEPQHYSRREEIRREEGRRDAEVASTRTATYDPRQVYETATVDAEAYDDYEASYEQQPRQRITTLHPRTYNEAKTIGLQFRGGTPVIMNLSEMDDADAKRLVDFAAGLTFGLYGSIERVTPKVFLLSPKNITVTAADKARIAEGGFYNQS